MKNGQWEKEDLFKFMEEKTSKMVQVCKEKNNDYTGANASPFANFEMVGHYGGSVEWGFFTRLSDKFSRISSFISNVQLMVKDESVEDTCIDMANYLLLFAAYLRSKKDKKNYEMSQMVLSAKLPASEEVGKIYV